MQVVHLSRPCISNHCGGRWRVGWIGVKGLSSNSFHPNNPRYAGLKPNSIANEQVECFRVPQTGALRKSKTRYSISGPYLCAPKSSPFISSKTIQCHILRCAEAASQSRRIEVPSGSVPPRPVYSDVIAWRLYALSTYFAYLVEPPVSAPAPWVVAVTLRAVHLEPQRFYERTNEWSIRGS